MALYLSKPGDSRDDSLDVTEVLGLLAEADRYKGDEKWFHIAQLMSRMSGETRFVEEFIKGLFASRSHFDIKDGYRDTSLVLTGVEGYRVRLNLWKPRGSRPIDVQTDVGLTYDLPHNHDFQLLTKGIWGPGYQTDVFRCEIGKTVGAYEEDVELTYQGRFQLSTGTVMWFEEFRDVHIQRPPASYSMSFNIIPINRTVQQGQLFFDVEKSRISGFPETSYARVLALLNLLCDIGQTEEVFELAVEIGSITRNDWFQTAMAYMIAERWNKPREEAFDILRISEKMKLHERFPADAFSSRHIG